MKTSGVMQINTRVLVVAAMLALVAYQLIGVFWGFELCDSGFYLTFYDHIYDAPETVSYNFMYYLSGLFGGLVSKVLPSEGSMVLMRLAGVLVNVLIMLLLYGTLRRQLGRRALLLGFAVVLLGYFKPVYTLSYDLFTSLFYVLAITLMYRGLTTKRLPLLLASGFVLGLNVFMRLPNVVGLSLIVLVVIGGRALDWTGKMMCKGVGAMMAGILMAVALMLALMLCLGHDRLFIDNVKELFAIAQDHSGEQSHSLGQMIMTQVNFYLRSLWAGVKIGAVLLVAVIIDRKVTLSWVRWPLLALLAVPVVWFVWRMHPLEVVWVMSFMGCVAVIMSKRGALRLLAWLGLAMLLLFPLGSDGAYNNGAIIAWVAAPVAMWVMGKNRVLVAFVCLFLLTMVARTVNDGAYFDGGNLFKKTAAINNPHARFLFTTTERKQVVDELLVGIAPYVHEGDTLLAYGSLATVNHLTGTCPYMGCSWPEQLSATALERKLEAGAKQLPWLLQQKFNTIAEVWPAPSDSYLMDYGEETVYHRNSKLQVLARFREKYGYAVVFENSHFVLYAPAGKHQ